ncbi:tubby-related protein 4-like [Saccostrea cucullata]|uniref:tubby-related protein 4-like n=1 Tax=Saccostrea cuccullata TaxID=36930 RepID=UPI002ED04C32
MHVHFEQNNSTRTECTIHSLSWMGKVPDVPDNNGGWKLNRNQYYMEGWLASGNAKGVVGVTFTTSHCKKYDPPPRSNFNLRGHKSEVTLVRWNEPYQKLATCDVQGAIFVWIKHEGRWSTELINDRNSQVTDFSWSHDGRMALICYCDGFVLVGSVAGQMYWSSMLNLDQTTITCGVWSPDDQQVLFGTMDGQIIVLSSTGTMVTQVMVMQGTEIISLAWSCEKFNMDESSMEQNENLTAPHVSTPKSVDAVLAVCFKSGAIYLMSNFDDLHPRIIYTNLKGSIKLDWSNCGEVLAVGGFTRLPNLQCQNEVHFYTKEGQLLHRVYLPCQGKPLSALCWGHNDRRLFVAAGFNLHVAWVMKKVPPLQFLCQRVIQICIKSEKLIGKLPLPMRLHHSVQTMFSPTIKSYIPDPFKLREFICSPPPASERLFCTMIRHGEETSGGHYTMYLEYLGGLIPLLKGKRASKLRPDFVIYDPKIGAKAGYHEYQNTLEFDFEASLTDSDEDIPSDGCGSPRMQRKKRPKIFRAKKVDRSITFRTLDELLYNDSLPESNKLVEVTSNIWGTKFKLTGLAPFLPEDLGNVLYKTSLLHLQPRQMTITITALSTVNQPLSRDPNFTPAGQCDEEWDSRSYDDFSVDPDDIGFEDGMLVSETCNGDNANQLTSHVFMDIKLSSNSTNQNDEKVLCDISGNISSNYNVLNGERLHWSPNMKNRTLSPASESVAQNNAFNTLDNSLIKDKLIGQGAIPKVRSVAQNGSQSEVTGGTPNGETLIQTNNSSSMRTSLHNEVTNIMKDGDENRWADLANPGIKFIDDEGLNNRASENSDNMAGIICDSSQLTPTFSDNQKRLYLETLTNVDSDAIICDHSPEPSEIGEESNTMLGSLEDVHKDTCKSNSVFSGASCSMFHYDDEVVDPASFTRKTSSLEICHSASLPNSPLHRAADSPMRDIREEILQGTCKHYSPIFKRKSRHFNPRSYQHKENDQAFEDIKYSQSFKNLETFQKTQLKQKLQKVRKRSEDRGRSRYPHLGYRQFVMHNKAPLWNENSQVYQLDFGGRVSQESAKNFQIEFRSRQVMQFGRIGSNAYTLDFQYPFTALQAFAVALANVTQRLK